MTRCVSHSPACLHASACRLCRASIILIACSAVVVELPNGVFITITPLAVAAGMSTLSTPMPARPMTFRRFAFSRTLGVTLVAERMARPSKSPITCASCSLSAPSLGWKSTVIPRSLKICTAAGESASEMRTLGDMAASDFVTFRFSASARSQVRAVAIRRYLSPGCRVARRHGWRGSRRFRQRVLTLGKGPIEPQRERLDISALHGRAAPDAQTRRRIAVGIDIVGNALLLQGGGDAFHERGLRIGG